MDWKDRLLDERDMLKERHLMLSDFVENVGNKETMPIDHWELLVIQLAAMNTYLVVLQTRLDKLGIPYHER